MHTWPYHYHHQQQTKKIWRGGNKSCLKSQSLLFRLLILLSNNHQSLINPNPVSLHLLNFLTPPLVGSSLHSWSPTAASTTQQVCLSFLSWMLKKWDNFGGSMDNFGGSMDLCCLLFCFIENKTLFMLVPIADAIQNSKFWSLNIYCWRVEMSSFRMKYGCNRLFWLFMWLPICHFLGCSNALYNEEMEFINSFTAFVVLLLLLLLLFK